LISLQYDNLDMLDCAAPKLDNVDLWAMAGSVDNNHNPWIVAAQAPVDSVLADQPAAVVVTSTASSPAQRDSPCVQQGVRHARQAKVRRERRKFKVGLCCWSAHGSCSSPH
jgi:hypothetical protein